MPRSPGDWEKWYRHREGKPTYAKGTKKPPTRKVTPPPSVHIIGEKSNRRLLFDRSYIEKNANYRRANPTPAEAELQRVLNELNGGVLKGRFKREHVISGKWIVDFFFPEIRLAIEVNGSIHRKEFQMKRDVLKESDAARFDITVLTIWNEEVFGEREELIEKLRSGWKRALARENTIIGKPYP